MRRTKIFYLLFLVLICCTKESDKLIAISSLDTASISVKDTAKVVEPSFIEPEIEEQITKNDFDILLPTRYRDWEERNPADDLTEKWIDLYEKDGKYFLGKADYKIERGFDECSGDSTKTIQPKNKALILLENDNLKLGEIQAVKFVKNKIWPTEKMSFRFNDVDYSLRAEGKVLSSERVHTDHGIEIFQNVEDYRIYISANNGPEHLFLNQKSFNDTFVELLFIGDIDRDGKPDFIFGANRDYEEERVLLYLSSDQEGKIIKKVSEIAVQFDC